MKIIKNLPKNICSSIHNYCQNQLSIYIERKFQLKKSRETFLRWYMDWISFVSYFERDTWKTVQKYKNNLSFINLVFKEFEKEVNLYFQSEDTETASSKLHSYYQYANELCIEAYGKELKKQNYLRSELLNIIKECESVIRDNLLHRKKPTHNVVTIR